MMRSVSRMELAPGYSISRVIKGSWQLAGGHGIVDEYRALEDMRLFVERGITTFDCADIYTGAERLIGRFLRIHGPLLKTGELPAVQVHTKFVPDLVDLPRLDPRHINPAIERSLSRLGVKRLDLVQFHWWDFGVPGYVKAALHLGRLQREGKIGNIGVTNFDALHLREVLETSVPVVSNQVQYSVLDLRPESGLLDLAEEYGVRLLAYGTVAGGFLSDGYLGAPQPEEPLENRSLVKYLLVIEEFGGWELFQELLDCLKAIGDRYGRGIGDVAIRYVMQKPQVAGVIVGARNKTHLDGLLSLEDFKLDEADLTKIEAVQRRASGPRGPVYGLERDRQGKYGRIMKYNLSRGGEG